MSIKKIESLSNNVLNIIVYIQSPSLEYHIKTKLKDNFKVHRDFVVTAETAKELNDAKLDSFVAPLLCDKWLVHVNADKLPRKELFSNLGKNTNHAITVYWTSEYRTYMQLSDSKEVKAQGVHCPVYTFTRMSYADIRDLHNELVPKKKHLKKELLHFVCNSYQFDVQAVLDLIAMIRSGTEVETRRDIIESIGVGGNSVARLVIRLLTAQPKTDKSRHTILGNTMRLLDDLSVTYNHSTIRNYMINNIDGCIEMKQLQIMGLYNRPNKEIPETFNQKRLNMLRRFEKTILHQITMPQLLNLRACLVYYNDFNADMALVQAISKYYATIPLKEAK